MRCKRDLVAELAQTCDRHLRLCLNAVAVAAVAGAGVLALLLSL